MIKTVSEMLVKSGDSCFIAKKGKKYIGWGNGELKSVSDCSQALAFASVETLKRFLDSMTVDSRNENLLGRSYDAVLLTRR